MKIDGHIKLGETFRNESFDVESYISIMERERIDQALICPMKPHSYIVDDGNKYVLEIMDKYPDTFIGAVRINPWDNKVMEGIMEQYLQRSDFRTIYLNPWEEQFQCNNPIVFPVIDFAKELEVPVIIEAGYPWVSQIFQIAELARRYPDVNFIATNAGQLDLSGSTLGDVAHVMDTNNNIFIGSSGACGAQWLTDIEHDHPGHVIFESNYPFMDPHIENFRIEKGFMTEKEKANIFAHNILNLLDM